MSPSDTLVRWAQFVFWCVATGVAIAVLLVTDRLGSVLERWDAMASATRKALVAARFLPDPHAGDVAPSTFPPRPSQPDLVALERRHRERRVRAPPPPPTPDGQRTWQR